MKTIPVMMNLLEGESELLIQRCPNCRHLLVLHEYDRSEDFSCLVDECRCDSTVLGAGDHVELRSPLSATGYVRATTDVYATTGSAGVRYYAVVWDDGRRPTWETADAIRKVQR